MKSALVTGATSGIGRALASTLANRGWRVLPHGRDPDKTRSLARSCGRRATPLVADLSSIADCQSLASQVRSLHAPLDALVLNAATVTPNRQSTPDGFERMFAVNHLAPFILTRDLLPSIRPGGHILVVSTDAHRWIKSLDLDNLQAEKKFRALAHYATTKAANLLASIAWSRLLAPSGITLSIHHPGPVATAFGLRGPWWLRLGWKLLSRRFQSPDQAAVPLAHALADPPVSHPGPIPYFSQGKPSSPAPFISDPNLQNAIWTHTRSLLDPFSPPDI